MEKKRIGILGSTGSIGRQVLEVVDHFPEKFEVEILTAHTHTDMLLEQAKLYHPKVIVISDENKKKELKNQLADTRIEILYGKDGLCEAASRENSDLLISAIVGFAGLRPTLAALEKGTAVALANKELLAAAGELVMRVAGDHHAQLIPMDSEQSAIFQCLQGESVQDIEKLILTASGGPFLGKKTNFLVNVKKDHALQHPNRGMGKKVSIDSATLMKKGLEMIEARWLFNLKPEQIEALIHPQSVIHSMVQFKDGSIKAQMGLPDMKIPIQYALTYPERWANDFKRLNFKSYHKLKFESPDIKTFRNLALAIQALNKGGNSACVMNAANEEVVQAFLMNTIGFLDMTEIIEKVMEEVAFDASASLDIYEQSDREARKLAQKLIEEKR